MTISTLPNGFNFAAQRIDRVRPRPNGPRHFVTTRWFVHDDERVAVMFGGERPSRLYVERQDGYSLATKLEIDAFMLELPSVQQAHRDGERSLEAAWSC